MILFTPLEGQGEERRSEGASAPGALEHCLTSGAKLPQISDQAHLYPLFVRDRVPAQPEGIILASHLFLLRIGGGWSRKSDNSQHEREGDHLLHGGAPITAERAASL
jgi:hypothetical protein